VSVPIEFKQEKLLTIGQVAEKMGVHRSTVWKWIRDQCLKATVPTVQDPDDPSKRLPISNKYRGVKPEDLASWQRVYRPDVSATRVASSKPKKKKTRAAKRANKKKGR